MNEDQRCNICGEIFGAGHRYCTRCGTPRPDTMFGIVKFVGFLLLLICIPMIFFEVYTLLWGAGEILANIGDYYLPIIILTPSPAAAFWITGTVANLYFLFLVAAVLASFAFLLYDSRNGFSELLRGETEKIMDAPIYAVITLFAAVISLNLIFNMILTSTGNPPAVPDMDMPDWELMYHVLNASVWEEILCRVLMIGVPMAIIGLMANREGSWKCLFGRFDMDSRAIALIIVSAMIFSYAHLDGWDVFKLLPTFVAGLALGYLFVKYGIHAAIMLHFIINYMSSAIWVFGETGTMAVLLGLFLLGVVFLGMAFIAYYTLRGFKFIMKTITKTGP